MRSALLSTRVAGIAAATVVASTVLAGTGLATAQAAPAGGPGHWSQVTPVSKDNIQDIGLARGGHSALNVIWSSSFTTKAGLFAVHDTVISSAGAVRPAKTIVSGQDTVQYPDATVNAGHVYAIWNGIAKDAPGSPEGTFIASMPIGGGAWSAPAVIPPLPAIPDISSSDSAAMGSDGKPWAAFDGTDSLTVVHAGRAEHKIPLTTCCYINPGLAVDGKSGATYIAYESIITNHQGVFAQRLNQNGTVSGKRVLLPGSQKHGLTPVLNERVAITGRGKGRTGVYALYETNYPAATGIDLIRLGGKPVRLAATNIFHAFAGAAVTSGQGGRLWTAWFEGDGSPAALFVRQSNDAVTKWGRTLKVKLPSATARILKVYISAQAGKVDVLALLTRHGKEAWYATQVR
jgi:hypothetical protein